jgi:hypothetical protein
MKSLIKKTTLCLCLTTVLLWLTACGSTRSENGVTIEQKSSYNPLN